MNWKVESSWIDRPEFSPRSLKRALWKQKVCLVVVWGLISLLGAAVVRRLPNVYMAETSVLVESEGIPE